MISLFRQNCAIITVLFINYRNCMGNKHKKSKLDRVQTQARRFYDRWRNSGSKSPAFKGEMIYITRIGWDHLVDPRKRRTTKEKIRRFEALPLAKKLLEVSTTYQEYRQDHGISFWAFQATLDGKKIKVVVSAKNKKKCFLSIIVFK